MPQPNKDPRQTAGPGARPDPIRRSREERAAKPYALSWIDPGTGTRCVAAPPPPLPACADDPHLDAAILVLTGEEKGDHVAAFKTFMTRAIYKEALYLPPESADTNAHLRRVGALGVAVKAYLLVGGAGPRVRERLRQDAERRKLAVKRGGEPG